MYKQSDTDSVSGGYVLSNFKTGPKFKFGHPKGCGAMIVRSLDAVPVGDIPEFAVPGIQDNAAKRLGVSRNAATVNKRNDDVAVYMSPQTTAQ